MKNLLYITFILLVITFQSCDLFNMDNDPMLPEITMEGAGTFGCNIGDELFLPKGPDPAGGMRGNPYATYTELTGGLVLKAQNTDNWSLSLSPAQTFEAGTYQMTTLSTVRDLLASECRDYKVDTLLSFISISLIDIEEDIISGTFQGTFVNECDSSNIIQITEGRFDLKYTL